MLVVLAEYHRMECHGTLARRLSRLAVTAATEVGRPDIEFEALMYLHQIELQFGLGQPQRSWDRLTRLIDVPAQGMPPWLIAFTHGFFASWDDETAEERVREGIKLTVDAGRYGDLCHLYIGLILVLIRKSRVGDAQAALDEADRLGAWTTSSHQEDMARILVREYAGDLDAARELTQRAIAGSRASGLVYWLAGFLAQLGFIETSARNWHAALEALRELAGIVASTQMADLEQLLWGVDYADAALQAGAEPDVEAAIAALRRQAAAGRPEAAIAADRCQALLTAAGGGADAAIGVLRAITGQPGSECPFEAARSGLALGQVYRRAGYKGLATETLNAAAAAFDELGIPAGRSEPATKPDGPDCTRPTAPSPPPNAASPNWSERDGQPGDRRRALHVGQDRRGQPDSRLPQAVAAVEDRARQPHEQQRRDIMTEFWMERTVISQHPSVPYVLCDALWTNLGLAYRRSPKSCGQAGVTDHGSACAGRSLEKYDF